MTMDMSYLPLGKMGCGNCEDVDYYCADCTRKILEVVNKAAAEKDAQANALMCGICGKKPALVCTECAKDIPRSVRLMQDVDNNAQINYHSIRIG